jgi:hypothetical protein
VFPIEQTFTNELLMMEDHTGWGKRRRYFEQIVENRETLFIMEFCLLEIVDAFLVFTWDPLNVITDNDQINPVFLAPNHSFICSSFAYCYHSANVISFSLSQSDHI